MFATNDMGFMRLGIQHEFSSFVLEYDNGGRGRIRFADVYIYY